jgi:hypothetical protein
MRKENLGIETTGMTQLRQTDLGIYVWEMPNGKILANDRADVLHIISYFGDISKQMELQKAAFYWMEKFGREPGGHAVFWESLPCTDEEYMQQLDEMDRGIMPNTNIRVKK